MGKIAVVLVNVGTPDSPSVKDVRKYLSQFLNDRRVIDLPWLLQKVLVNLIIVPFRAPKSAKLYQQLWSDKGSPLLYHSQSVATKLQVRIGDQYLIFNAMRYGNPSLNNVLQQIKLAEKKRSEMHVTGGTKCQAQLKIAEQKQRAATNVTGSSSQG